MAEQKTIGQIAYEAWFGSLSLKDGKTPMDWPGDMDKDEWEAAASAVWDKAVEECASHLEIFNFQMSHDFDDEALEAIADVLRSLKRSDKTEKPNG